MLAAFYTRQGRAREVLRVDEVNTPTPGPGEVRVRLCASGINPADVKRRAGSAARQMVFPIVIPHNDGTGVIDAVGSGVSPAREGERVWTWNAQWQRAFGTAAEYVTLPCDRAVPLPAGVSFEVGAALGVAGMTAHRCVSVLGDLQGRSILVYGAAGAVGSLAVQLARARGAQVVGVVRTAAAEAVAATLRMGARACLAGGEPGFADAAAALAAPQGFDHIIDVDFAANCDAYTRLLARDGSVVAFGSASQMSPDIDVLALQKHGVTLHFVSGAGQRPAHQALAIQDLNQALAEGRLEVRMDSAYGLQEIVLAHERVESSGLAGKVLVRVEPCVGAR